MCTHLKLCTATRNFEWVKNIHIKFCLILDQTFANFDVKEHISFSIFFNNSSWSDNRTDQNDYSRNYRVKG